MNITTSDNSNLYQESVILTSPIPTKIISIEEKEENEFLKRIHKEQIKQFNLCDIKTVTLETNPKNSTE
ncbi:2490_t:CDS:2, partial [Diversispora eburnea]